jgi:hypothetical protein
MEKLPSPADPRVKIKEVKSRLFAAFTYSGTWSEERYRQHEAALLRAAKNAGLITIGEPIFARYNSPFTLWFLRKNEVLADVEEGTDAK